MSNVGLYAKKFRCREGNMISLSPPYRHAVQDDARALAELVNIAGDGFPLHVWKRMAQPGETAWDVGRRRAAGDFIHGGSSYRNAVVVDEGAGAVAALVGYPLRDVPEPIGPDTPAMFVPMLELENEACGTWYINVLAAYTEHRRLGHGSRLLSIAELLMRDSGLARLSLIVSDTALEARRLYERVGYRQLASREMVKEDWQNPGTTWRLLVKTP
jgi:ribosomal protein S18 acetylase RimI-like enzyme